MFFQVCNGSWNRGPFSSRWKMGNTCSATTKPSCSASSRGDFARFSISRRPNDATEPASKLRVCPITRTTRVQRARDRPKVIQFPPRGPPTRRVFVKLHRAEKGSIGGRFVFPRAVSPDLDRRKAKQIARRAPYPETIRPKCSVVRSESLLSVNFHALAVGCARNVRPGKGWTK